MAEKEVLMKARDRLVQERVTLLSERDGLLREREVLVAERDALKDTLREDTVISVTGESAAPPHLTVNFPAPPKDGVIKMSKGEPGQICVGYGIGSITGTAGGVYNFKFG